MNVYTRIYNYSLKVIVFLSFLIVLTNCKNSEERIYTKGLEDCLSTDDIQLLNKLTADFENHIIATYNMDRVKAYKQYLEEASQMQLASVFFENLEFIENVRLLKKSEFFKSSRVKLSVIEDYYENTIDEDIQTTESLSSEEKNNKTDQEYDHMTVYNPKGNYIQCLLNKNDNSVIQSYLNQLTDGLVILPTIGARTLQSSLKNEDYNNDLVKLFIAINIHYEMMMMLTEETEKQN